MARRWDRFTSAQDVKSRTLEISTLLLTPKRRGKGADEALTKETLESNIRQRRLALALERESAASNDYLIS